MKGSAWPSHYVILIMKNLSESTNTSLNQPKSQISLKNVGRIALVFLLVAFFLSTVSAETKTSDLQVNVSIAEEVIIDIQPSNFAWGTGANSVFPGTIAGKDKEQNGYGKIQIENLGSVNISQVWFNTTTPSQRPFGSGSASNYNSGNFISLKRTGSSKNPRFVNRKEFGLDQPGDKDIIYLETNSNWDYGRFRNTSYEYFWTVNDQGTSLDGKTFRIGNEHHNETQTGTTGLNTECMYGDESAASGPNCNGYTLNNVSVDGNYWAVTEVEVGAADTNLNQNDGGVEYCVAMDADQVIGNEKPEVHFIKWNAQHQAVEAAGSGSDCAEAANYTIGSNSPTQELAPGDWINMNINAMIPYGVVSGNIPAGNLIVLAKR